MDIDRASNCFVVENIAYLQRKWSHHQPSYPPVTQLSFSMAEEPMVFAKKCPIELNHVSQESLMDIDIAIHWFVVENIAY